MADRANTINDINFKCGVCGYESKMKNPRCVRCGSAYKAANYCTDCIGCSILKACRNDKERNWINADT